MQQSLLFVCNTLLINLELYSTPLSFSVYFSVHLCVCVCLCISVYAHACSHGLALINLKHTMEGCPQLNVYYNKRVM